MTTARKSRILRTILLLIAVCLVSIPAQAQYGGGSGTTASAETNTYVFLPGQSTVVQTGGIAGVHRTYSVEGLFQLTVAPDAGTASFAHVNANATDDSPLRRTLDPNEVFNMTSLLGAVLDDTTISFTGKAADGSDVLITLNIEDDLAYLVGQTIPPPNTADFFLFSLDAVAQRKYGGGSGEPNDPYLIYTAEHLNAIGADANDWDKHFILMADIDLSAYSGTQFNIIGIGWYGDDVFRGVFDGNGHTISNFSYISTDRNYVGLFGYVDGENALIKDLGLIDPNVDVGTYTLPSRGIYIGSLVGRLNEGTVTGCYVDGGSATGTAFVGGLVGYNSGTISGCYVDGGRVSGNEYVGGLVGRNFYGTITWCYVDSGSVSGEDLVGGLVGRNNDTIADCYATGDVTGQDKVGGLVGSCGGTITNCYATDSISGDEWVGGLVGYNNGTISNCYATSSVSGETNVGGLVGDNRLSGTITNCYATGSVSGTGWYVGGLVGYNWRKVTDSLWDIETSGQVTSVAGTGKTTAEMQMESTFTDAGWDFVGESVNGTEDIWWILEGQDYPRLWWEFLVVDDFESYNDFEPDIIFDTWMDGWGVETNGSEVGYAEPNFTEGEHFVETDIVHGGFQSMPYFYDNSGPANYSEATANIANLVIDRDWTKYGATVLSMWFYGDPANAPEPMYVAIANYNGPTAVVYHDNPDSALIDTWTEWKIDLTKFSDQGVDLTDVDTISIGFGDKNNPVPGGSGLVFFDDIRLYRPPESEPVQ